MRPSGFVSIRVGWNDRNSPDIICARGAKPLATSAVTHNEERLLRDRVSAPHLF
jgi:hypothetical protein